MKLYDVPQRQNIKIKIIENAKNPPAHREFEEGEVLTFHNIDGMYSRCTDKEGNTVHLAAYADVEIVE